MFIIAESGSTKTDWVVLNDGKIYFRATTSGYNPNYFPESVLSKSALELAQKIDTTSVFELYFYGSGCSSPKAINKVRNTLGDIFDHAKISVFHDLFGAARALFGAGSGIASILGTGSSSCLMVDGEIAEVVPSLGYLLADEGSGFQLGQLLVNAYFKGDLPDDLLKLFQDRYDLEIGSFINDLYGMEKPNAMISSYAPFVVENKEHPFITELVLKSFVSFFEENILKYADCREYALGFVGSIAFLFRDLLEKVAEHYNIKVEKVIKGPVDELVKFHGGGEDG